MATITTKRIRRPLFATKNLQSESEGQLLDSGRVHLGGFNVRANQNNQKVDFEYPPSNLTLVNLGTRQSYQGRRISKKVRQLTFLEIEHMRTLAYQLFDNYAWFMSSRRAKIVILVFVAYVVVVVRTFLLYRVTRVPHTLWPRIKTKSLQYQ